MTRNMSSRRGAAQAAAIVSPPEIMPELPDTVSLAEIKEVLRTKRVPSAEWRTRLSSCLGEFGSDTPAVLALLQKRGLTDVIADSLVLPLGREGRHRGPKCLGEVETLSPDMMREIFRTLFSLQEEDPGVPVITGYLEGRGILPLAPPEGSPHPFAPAAAEALVTNGRSQELVAEPPQVSRLVKVLFGAPTAQEPILARLTDLSRPVADALIAQRLEHLVAEYMDHWAPAERPALQKELANCRAVLTGFEWVHLPQWIAANREKAACVAIAAELLGSNKETELLARFLPNFTGLPLAIAETLIERGYAADVFLSQRTFGLSPKAASKLLGEALEKNPSAVDGAVTALRALPADVIAAADLPDLERYKRELGYPCPAVFRKWITLTPGREQDAFARRISEALEEMFAPGPWSAPADLSAEVLDDLIRYAFGVNEEQVTLEKLLKRPDCTHHLDELSLEPEVISFSVPASKASRGEIPVDIVITKNTMSWQSLRTANLCVASSDSLIGEDTAAEDKAWMGYRGEDFDGEDLGLKEEEELPGRSVCLGVLKIPDAMQCGGVVLLHVVDTDGAVLLCITPNPSSRFLYEVDQKIFTERLIEKLAAFAEEKGFDGLVISCDPQIRTNRSRTKFAATLYDLELARFDFKTEQWFSTDPSYDLKTMAVLWEAPGADLVERCGDSEAPAAP